MSEDISRLVHLLRNISVRRIVNALTRDGFVLERQTRTGGRIYYHPDDDRIVVIHYHTGRDTLTRRTLRSVLEGTHWNEDDVRRLRLIR